MEEVPSHRPKMFHVIISGSVTFTIAVLLTVEWLSHWPLLKILGLAAMLVFVSALVFALAFVEDKSVLKGLLILLSPIPFLAVALFLGASGMLSYALLLIFVITLVRFAVIIPSLRKMTQKQNTKV